MKVRRLRRSPLRRMRDALRPRRLRVFMLMGSWPSPPLTGALQRWWATIRFLGKQHDLTVATFHSEDQLAHRALLLRYCREVHAAPYQGPTPPEAASLPALVAARQTVAMREALRAVPWASYDAVVVEQIFMAGYREVISAPAILAEHNIESSLLRQAAAGHWHAAPPVADPAAEAERLREFEDRVWPQFPVRTAVTELERVEIQRRSVRGRTLLVENGVFLKPSPVTAQPEHGPMLFTGMLNYYPNVDAVHYLHGEILPRLARLRPGIRLVVAGRAPDAGVAALDGRDGVRVVSDPTDMAAVAAQASVAVVPLRLGAGSRIKILEALAWGLPVVTTTLGAEGLHVVDGEHVLIRDDSAAFAEAVAMVLQDNDLWLRLRRNGRRLVEERYGWDRVLRPLNQAVIELASR